MRYGPVAALCAVVFFLAPTGRAYAQGRPKAVYAKPNGTIEAVDPKERTLTVRYGKKSFTYKVPAEVKVELNAKDADLKDLAKGYRASLVFADPAVKNLVRIAASKPVQPPSKEELQKRIDSPRAGFKVGRLVRLDVNTNNVVMDLLVHEVLGENKAVLSHADDRGFKFLLEGHPTKGMVDDQLIRGLPGDWLVARTARVNGRTMFVVTPAPKSTKK